MLHEPKETNPIAPDTRNEEKKVMMSELKKRKRMLKMQMKMKKRVKTM